MKSAFDFLWLVPVLPLLAAIVICLIPGRWKRVAAGLSIGSMIVSFLISCSAFALTLAKPTQGTLVRKVQNLVWIQVGNSPVEVGWILDPLTALMLVMVTFVGTLIFIYSVGYMSHDTAFSRFFCCLSLFASAMLGLIISNSLLLTFMCWELVGLASYLLIGFWYHKPEAAAAAQKAFITTRVGDIGFFIGILWLASASGTLLFYNNGFGCLETKSLSSLVAQTTFAGMAVSTAISLLLFCGACGKSGQVPLHVWLPDAMEGPTPVSALIHAATMVAAGVFLVARLYPLLEVDKLGLVSPLAVVTWIGAITAVFAATIAVAQTDIKRILAYSTVSQLGYMMMGIGVGGVEVGMFHLITHAFFKALLFLGAGSVIHGCHEEQDIRHMGGLKKFMPITFATYAIGMMALAGFPLVFSGFWSKDGILHAAHSWKGSHLPFYLGLAGAVLTAFYMTRQMFYVFFGTYRAQASHQHAHGHAHASDPHESPAVMTVPLAILALCAIALSFVGTPAFPWFQGYLTGKAPVFHLKALFESEVLQTMLVSTVCVGLGVGAGFWIYGRKALSPGAPDSLEISMPGLFRLLQNKYYVDELYRATFIRLNAFAARLSDMLDRWVWGGVVFAIQNIAIGFAWVSKFTDEFLINLGFDQGCKSIRKGGTFSSGMQNGQIQGYLRAVALALTALLILLSWGGSR